MSDNIQYLKGVGEKRARLMKKLGIDSVDALFRYYPRSYTDLSTKTEIFKAELGKTVCVCAKLITAVEERTTGKNMTLYKFLAADKSGSMTVTLFNRKYLANSLHEGSTYLFYGKLTGNDFYREMSSPEIMDERFSYIHPVYPATVGLPSSVIEKIIKTNLPDGFDDFMPEELIEKYRLSSLSSAINNIHFPKSYEALKNARRRLMFEELFLLQCGFALLRKDSDKNSGKIIDGSFAREFWELLPFSPTDAQKRVTSECLADMCGGKKCNRLIQGDVGSGKTAVAAALIYTVKMNGMQSALMAPTEILAEQHYKTLSGFFGDSVKIELLTGSTKRKEKERIKAALKNGEIDAVVGTHALITDDVEFNNPALVITDEQHRFGVAQREKLAGKGSSVHTVVMSATPIPRTLALIIYGDLDVSVIDELPKGRAQIESYAVESALHPRLYNFIKKQIDEGRQAYIVCPLVEEGETDLLSAEKYAEELQNGAFKNYRVGVLHGKMSNDKKDAVMREFSDGNIDLLVATTVVEVGVDVPNATVMVIENAERFGLSQLHQLRGRIGRGKYKSTCVFVSDDKSKLNRERLKTLCETNDGFAISDVDLTLRGPGDFIGHRQHGLPELKIADMQTDLTAMKIAGEEARKIIEADPTLSRYPLLKNEIDRLFKTAYII